jgi:hypothetical protein
MTTRLLALIAVAVGLSALAACDSDITGELLENLAPDTQLSVRDTSLVENREGFGRFPSSVSVSWSGTDPDGFVASFELRAFDRSLQNTIGPEEGWHPTTSRDSVVLLPIPFGERVADVVFEARAIDNLGLKDPTPSRTVFPVENGPPSLRLSTFDIPPDETFTVFSFGWSVFDPEGEITIDRIEVSFNDSTSFVSLPGNTRFATFLGALDETNPEEEVVEAEVYTGRGFLPSDVFVPGLRLDSENTFYIRAVDQTDTASVRQEFSWTVTRPRGEVLYVSDYRKASEPIVREFHMGLLQDYLPPETEIEIYNISEPYLSGSTSAGVTSDALPASAAPTLEQTFLLFDFIYWVSTGVTATTSGNNLAFAAPALNSFFANGGKMMIHTPVQLPGDPEDFITNPAIALLPLTDVITFPDSLRPSLRLPNNGVIAPVAPIPGPDVLLPELKANRLIIRTLPYVIGGNITPLYEAAYEYQTRTGGRRGTWEGPATVASISSDRRVALMALPIVSETDGTIQLEGSDGSPQAAVDALYLMLDALEFPR